MLAILSTVHGGVQIIVEEKTPAAKLTPDQRVFQTTRCNEFPQEHHTGEK